MKTLIRIENLNMKWKWACVLCKDKTQGGRGTERMDKRKIRTNFPKLDRKLKTLAWMIFSLDEHKLYNHKSKYCTAQKQSTK
jgi:hypothetical protein